MEHIVDFEEAAGEFRITCQIMLNKSVIDITCYLHVISAHQYLSEGACKSQWYQGFQLFSLCCLINHDVSEKL